MDTREINHMTGWDLNDVTPLLLPWARDPWGILRPPVSSGALQLSADLCYTTYTMDMEPWQKAGWFDMTMQIDHDLFGGLDQPENTPEHLAAVIKSRVIQSRVHQKGIIHNVGGWIRQQHDEVDTGKTIFMIHRAPGGRYIVGLAFMGTGTRLYDWVANLRMQQEDGFHQGFLQLTRQVEKAEVSIHFPETAKELSLPDLTLSDILAECTRPDSRFLLWLTGHSQGGAILQIYMARKINQGIRRENMIAVGFAAPSVTQGQKIADFADYPICLVVNSDDLVPRSGAWAHLGMMLIYPVDDEMRKACYGWSWDEESVEARAAVRTLIDEVQTFPDCLEMGTAYLQTMQAESPERIASAIQGTGILTRLPLDRLFELADGGITALLKYAIRMIADGYESVLGRPMDEEKLKARRREIQGIIASIGQERFTPALKQLGGSPHTCGTVKPGGYPSYLYIAKHLDRRRIEGCWHMEDQPRLELFDPMGLSETISWPRMGAVMEKR